MLLTALELVSGRLAYRARRALRRGILMIMAGLLATIAFIFLLIGAYALLIPEVGRANAAFILAGALALASIVIALLASRSNRRGEPTEQARAELSSPGAQKRAVTGRNDTIGLIIAAFAAGLVAGRKW